MTGEELRRLRLQQGLTQAQAEAAVGVENRGRTWRRWEHGERRVPPWLERSLTLLGWR